MSMDAQTDVEQIGLRFLDAVYRMDGPAVLAMLSDDIEWWLLGNLPASGVYVGKEAVVNDMLSAFGPVWGANTTSHDVRHVVAAGDHVVVELVGGGTTAHGNRYENFYCFVLRARDGRIDRVRTYTDTGYALGMLWGPQRERPSFD